MLFIAAIINAFSVQKPYYQQSAFVDTYLLDEFSYAHKYFNKKGN